jgi:hypothetical protein
MQHFDSDSSDRHVAADTSDDFVAPVPVVEDSLDGTSARRPRARWNYTASVHLVGAALAVRPARGTVAAANHVEARERARRAAERLFRASGQVVSVVITRLW